LDRVDYFVKVLGLVNSGGDFSSQPAVINGFSDLMVEVFGRRGQHARSAMGAFALPMNVPVIVDAIVKIRN
jgi:enamine deaminase RidA (YjgF/YER057c/UK114 family)